LHRRLPAASGAAVRSCRCEVTAGAGGSTAGLPSGGVPVQWAAAASATPVDAASPLPWQRRKPLPLLSACSGRRGFAKAAKKGKKKGKKKKGGAGKRTVYLPEDEVSVPQLAWLLQMPEQTVEEGLKRIGAAYGTRGVTVDRAEAGLLAEDLGLVPKEWTEMPTRPPIVTVMGHVDHGKTSLLDALRKTQVAEGEHGGITQHIGAFTVSLPSQPDDTITFLDTPGHSAFEAMRARGAVVTDIVVLVVAADDGVQPQTVEAIKHADNAGVPIIVAVNKCDLPGVDPQRVLEQLAASDPPVVVEEFGGDAMAVSVSALTGEGLTELEETILLQAELMEYRACPECDAEGVVVEAWVETGQGTVANVLVKRGTLNVGDFVCAGAQWGKVKRLMGSDAKAVRHAGPSVPVQLVGLKGCPETTDSIVACESEKAAKERAEALGIARTLAQQQADEAVVEEARELEAMNADDTPAKPRPKGKFKKHEFAKFMMEKEAARMAQAVGAKPSKRAAAAAAAMGADGGGDSGLLHVVIKADVQGSAEALADALAAIQTENASVDVLRAGVGLIAPGDISLATTTDPPAVVFGFGVKPDKGVENMARREGVDLKMSGEKTVLFSHLHIYIRSFYQDRLGTNIGKTQKKRPLSHLAEIIYDLIDDVEERLDKGWGKQTETVIVGRAEVLKVFALRGQLKGTVIAGVCALCLVFCVVPVLGFVCVWAGLTDMCCVMWFVCSAGVRLDTGKITSGSLVRVLRNVPPSDEEGGTDSEAADGGELSAVGRGKVATIHHHAATIEEHAEIGGECGVCLGATFTGFEEGDVLEMIEEVDVQKA
jgi:small GTP-binding protein